MAAAALFLASRWGLSSCFLRLLPLEIGMRREQRRRMDENGEVF